MSDTSLELLELILSLSEAEAEKVLLRLAEIQEQKESASLFKTESISEHPQQSTL